MIATGSDTARQRWWSSLAVFPSVRGYQRSWLFPGSSWRRMTVVTLLFLTGLFEELPAMLGVLIFDTLPGLFIGASAIPLYPTVGEAVAALHAVIDGS